MYDQETVQLNVYAQEVDKPLPGSCPCLLGSLNLLTRSGGLGDPKHHIDAAKLRGTIAKAFQDVQPADAPLLEGQNRQTGLRGEGGFRGDGGQEEDDDGTAFEPRRPHMETVAHYPPEHEDPQVAGKHPYKRPLR